MTNIITIIIASACFGITFVESGIPNAVKRFLMRKKIWYKKGHLMGGNFIPDKTDGTLFTRRIKPFDCEFCMAFWICLTLLHYKAGLLIMESIGYSCISAVITKLTMKIINR